MGLVALAGFSLLITFLITVVTRRGHRIVALTAGFAPAAILVAGNLPGLNNPLGWAVILPVLAAGVAGGFVGAWLARLVHAWWRRA
jgi:hypothetical protein